MLKSVLRLTAACLAMAATLAIAQAPKPVTAPVRTLGPGMVGQYYAPPRAGGPMVLVLGGSEGGTKGSGPLARTLASEGFGAL